MKTLRSQVEHCLKEYPETRNSDVALTEMIWRVFYESHVFTTERGAAVLLKDLFELPREDNVKRERAALNAKGLYLPTDWKVAKGRRILEDVWLKALGYPTKAETAHPTRADSYTEPERSMNDNPLFR